MSASATPMDAINLFGSSKARTAKDMRQAVRDYKSSYSEQEPKPQDDPAPVVDVDEQEPAAWPLRWKNALQVPPPLPDPAGFTNPAAPAEPPAPALPDCTGLFVLAGPDLTEEARDALNASGATLVELPFHVAADTTHLLSGAAAIAAAINNTPNGKG